MQLSTLIERTPRRVVVAFVFAYSCTLIMALLPALNTAQMFWQ
jgi:hypothetical protein